MPETHIRFTLPLDLYEQVSDILNGQSLTAEDAAVLLYRYIVAKGALPFDVQSIDQSNQH